MGERLSKTPLAYWLNDQMAFWRDPDTDFRGISQRALALKIGIPQSSLSGILKAEGNPLPSTLAAIAEFFEIHPLIIYFITYHMTMEQATEENFENLNKLGHALFKMPEGVVLQFLESQPIRTEAARIVSEHWDSVDVQADAKG